MSTAEASIGNVTMDWIALGFAVTLFVLVTAPRRHPLDLLDD